VVYAGGNQDGWVVKAQLLHDRYGVPLANNNKEEWLNCRNIGAVAALIPKVFGYAETEIMGSRVSFIFVQRVGFTVQDMLRKMVTQQINYSAARILIQTVVMVVNTQMRCVHSGITPHDWHMGNLGFEDKKDEDMKTLKLIDWQGNKPSAAPESFNQRMETSFMFFIDKFGLHKDAIVQTGWPKVILTIRKITKEWWHVWSNTNRAVDELPTEDDTARLSDALIDAVLAVHKEVKEKESRAPQTYGERWEEERTLREVLEAATVVTIDATKSPLRVPITRITGQHKSQIDGTNRTQSSPTIFGCTMTSIKRRRTATVVKKTTSPRVRQTDFDVVVGSTKRQPITAVVKKTAPPRVRPTDFDVVVGTGKYVTYIGRLATCSLIDMVRKEQAEHEQRIYKHGRKPVPGRSMPVDQRIAEGKFHYLHGPPRRPTSEGNQLGFLFRLFLAKIEAYGYRGRCTKVPRTASDPIRFHQRNWTKFTENMLSSWGDMSMSKKRDHLHEFLTKKFSLDPSHDPQVMTPGKSCKRKKRNEAGWLGFYLSDAELNELVDDIMKDYSSKYTT
jgi:hypothetical protein